MRTALIAAIVIGIGSFAFTGCSSNTPEDPTASTGGSGGAEQDASDAAIDIDPGMEASTHKPYPTGPFGVVKNTLIQNYKFLGWENPKEINYTGDLQPIELADFYDPDGVKGIKALFINASARWCSVCRAEQKDIAAAKLAWGDKGVYFLETLFEGAPAETAPPATLDDLIYWTKTYKIDWYSVIDPNNKLSPFFDTTATPMNMVVDTKTMTIKTLITGAPDGAAWFNTEFAFTTAQ